METAIKALTKFHQGVYRPKNPEKYWNPNRLSEIVYRSSWEKCLMIWFDNNPDVIKWGSEEVIIRYISKFDGKPHRYFLDFVVLFNNGTKLFVEVKPECQTREPVMTESKARKRFLMEVKTYAINTSKWDAAKAAAIQDGGTFVIWTERELAALGINLNVSKQFRYVKYAKKKAGVSK